MATFVVVHGAWGGESSWNKFVVPRLQASGHTVHAATLTGLGNRTHLAHPGIDLDTHVQDVANVLFYEDLHDVTLVGHSYGGRVITGVACTSADRLAHLVYLDAFVPTPENPGGTTISSASQARIDAEGDGWRNPPGDAPPDQPPEIIEWARPRRSWQPVKTFTQPVRFTKPALARTYVYCTVGKDPSSPFAKLAAQVRDDPAWTYHQLETGHNLHRPRRPRRPRCHPCGDWRCAGPRRVTAPGTMMWMTPLPPRWERGHQELRSASVPGAAMQVHGRDARQAVHERGPDGLGTFGRHTLEAGRDRRFGV